MRTWAELPEMRSSPLTAELLAASDAVLLITDHSQVDYDLVCEHPRYPARRQRGARLTPMPTIAVSTSSFARHDPQPLERLREAGYEVRLNPHGRRLDRAETLELLDGVVGLVAGDRGGRIEVLDLRIGPQFLLEAENLFVLQYETYLAARVEQIAKDP